MKWGVHILYLFIPGWLISQVTFDKRYNTAEVPFTFDDGLGLIETDVHYIVYGLNEEKLERSIPFTDTTRPMFLVVDKIGQVVNNSRFENNTCLFGCHNYIQNDIGEFIGIGSTLTGGDTCGVSINGGYPIRGRMYLHKLDSYGNLIWQQNYGDTLYNNINIAGADIARCNDGNYILLGERKLETYLLKMNEQGDTLWSKVIDGYYFTDKHNIEKVKDGFLCFMGFGVLKLDNQGDTVWSKYLGVNLNEIKRTADGGIIINSDASFNPYLRTKLTKIDQDANIVWQQTYEDLYAYDGLCETSDGDFVVASKDFAKVDSLGNILWKRRFFGESNINPWYHIYEVIETSDGGFLLSGHFETNTMLIKTDCEGHLEWSTESCLLPTEEDVLVFPNPVQDQLIIQMPNIDESNEVLFTLYNTTGQRFQEAQTFNKKILTVAADQLPSGIYLYRLVVDGRKYASGKIIKN